MKSIVGGSDIAGDQSLPTLACLSGCHGVSSLALVNSPQHYLPHHTGVN